MSAGPAESDAAASEAAASGAAHPAAPLLAPLAEALRRTVWERARLQPLPDSGLAHHHVALVGSDPPALARIPKQSQLRLDAVANLEYQAACFARAEPSGHTPRLFEVLPPSAGLARGALIVEHVNGRAAVIADAPGAQDRSGAPDDLDAIVRALASIHSLAVPAVRAPLMSAADPLADLADEIGVQAQFLDRAGIDPEARRVIDGELARLANLVRQEHRPSAALISFDAHPGNFLVRPNGDAVLVDLEKCRYSYPSLDLAHATLYTSTTWEPGATSALDADRVRRVHELWESITADPDASRWHIALRRHVVVVGDLVREVAGAVGEYGVDISGWRRLGV